MDPKVTDLIGEARGALDDLRLHNTQSGGDAEESFQQVFNAIDALADAVERLNTSTK